MHSRRYEDLEALRRDVAALVIRGRYRFTRHAETDHPEIPAADKLAAILYGGQDRPNRNAAPNRPSYVCWYRHPRLGLLRAVYAISEPPEGGELVIITVFQE